MERATEPLRVLLAAAVAHSSNATSIAGNETNVQQAPIAAPVANSGIRETTTHTRAFTAEDRAVWNMLVARDGDERQQLADDIGLLVATTGVADIKLVQLLGVLARDERFDCVGVLLVVQATYRGFKVAKRWDALALAAHDLPDAVYPKIFARETALLALQFWLELLLGCQHEATLYLRRHGQLAALATWLSEQQRNANNDIAASDLAAMQQHLIVACAALAHCHRGYEREQYVLQLALTQAFGADAVAAPNAAAATTLLRDAAWVLPHDALSQYVPTIEGKWVVDEFAGEPHALGVNASPAAGSVLLHATRDCIAHELSASVVDRNGAPTLRLCGLLFQQLPALPMLLESEASTADAPWELEGHWSQVYASTATIRAASAPVVSATATAWTCAACTMHNDAAATKCATCGTASPTPPVTIQSSLSDVPGSNPAPFTATFDATYSFMRIAWSRGEQHGVWLAQRLAPAPTRTFALHGAIAAAAGTSDDAMTDASAPPSHAPLFAYSADGCAARVLVLEKPVVASATNGGSDSVEFTLQLWLRAQAASNDGSAQVVVASGTEFALALTPARELVLDVADSAYTLRAPTPLRADTFYHVTLALGPLALTLLVDGAVVAECALSTNITSLFASARASVCAIGGRVDSNSCSVSSVFTGVVCDVRMWSTAQPPVAPTAALAGDEPQLLAYYPLVGAGPRLLLDASRAENHATVYDAYVRSRSTAAAQPVVVSNFAPTAALDALPVTFGFASALGDAFIASGRFALLDDDSALALDLTQSGSALWHAQPVALATGFTTRFAVQHAPAVVLALCDATYWSVAPLIDEATNMLTVAATASQRVAGAGANLTALFVSIETVRTGTSSSAAQYAIALWVRTRGHAYKLGAARHVVATASGSDAAAAPVIHVTYALPTKVLTVSLGASGSDATAAIAVLECAVDVALALGLAATSSVRAGLVFPAAADSTARLCEWRYDALDVDSDTALTPSTLASVYADVAAFQPPRASSDTSATTDALESTVLCTRCTTDGSAVEQEAYGCQTCGVVHGSALCRVCAAVCHDGHELVAMGVLSAACACHLRGAGRCRCSTPMRAADAPQLQHAITAPLWCCSKCTVLNATALRTCSICGHAAPAVATSAAMSTSSAAPVSTSRALALVESSPAKDVAVSAAADWSCDACTMLNAASATKCSICDTVRAVVPTAAATSASASAAAPGMLALYSAAESVAKPPPPATTWTCGACTMENKSADAVCYMCSTPNTVGLPAAAVASPTEVIMATPPPATTMTDDPPLLPVPIDLTHDDSSASSAAPATSAQPPSAAVSAAVANLRRLGEYKRSVAEAAVNDCDVVDALRDSRWETTVSTASGSSGSELRLALHARCVATYVDGAYAERDNGYVRGVARVTADGVWKLEGTYRKATHACANAVVLQWDAAATRFDGKWFRGDGSGDWKCVLAPATSLFRGLRRVDDANDSVNTTTSTVSNQQELEQTQLQPFYSGLFNMSQGLTNVCYQNSFLQTLFMTQAFRQLILSCDLSASQSAIASSDSTPSAPDVLQCVQHLFARLLASQQPALATHALQRCLPSTFQTGRQQDTSDFAHFVIDALSEQLVFRDAPDIADVFGGTQATVLACKSCGTHSVYREYFWELLLNLIDLRYTPITGITAVSGATLTLAAPRGYERLNTDVNKDRTGAPYVFLCVKRSPERAGPTTLTTANAMDVDDADDTDTASLLPITDLVVKVASFHDVRPTLPGYERVELDLNVGGSANVLGGKKQVYLFTRREPHGSPITDLQVIYNNDRVPDGFKQINVDLNQGDGGTKVFLCYRCDMPITDVKLVTTGIPGYRMVDAPVNLQPDAAVKQYVAYQVGGTEPCVTDMALVDGPRVAQYEADGWSSIGAPSTVATTTAVAPVVIDTVAVAASPTTVLPAQLMVRRGHGNPIFAIDVFRAPRQVPKYNDYEVIDVYPRASASSDGDADARIDTAALLQGDWMASDDTDRARRAVRIHSVSAPLPHALVVHGAFDDKGEVLALASATASWATAAGGTDPAAADSAHVFRVTGHWKSAKAKHAQLFDVELRPDATTGLYALSGTVGDGRGRSVAVQGVQTSHAVKVKWPISELLVLRGDEKVPEGVKVVRETCSGRSGNLLAQTSSPHSLYLAVKRAAPRSDGNDDSSDNSTTTSYVSDVCVIYGEIDVVPDGFTCISTTPGGFSANVNDGTSGVPIFICYRRVASTSTDKVVLDVLPMWTSGPQAETLPTEFTKIQHTPLGMDANLNEGTQGVAIHLCVNKTEPSRVVQPIASALNGEYEILPVSSLAALAASGGSAAAVAGVTAGATGLARFLSLSVMERVDDARVVEGKFGTVLHAHLPGAFRATVFRAVQRRTPETLLLGAWSLETTHPTTMSDFTVTNYPFELALSDSGEELNGWWSGPDDAAVGAAKASTAAGPSAPLSISTSTSSSTSSTASSGGGGAWKLVKDAYVRIGFKKDYGTEWKDGQLLSSERVWRHDIASMLARLAAPRTLGGDNARACATCARKTESRTHTVVVTPPAHLILTVKRMFYDWTHQTTRKSLHDVSFPALLTLPALSSDDEDIVFGAGADSVAGTVSVDASAASVGTVSDDSVGTSNDHATHARADQRSRQYGLYGVLIHSGMSANSGHYYSFCRESDDAATQQLHLEDAPNAPWIKFNDTKVARSSWHEIRRLVAHSVSDAVYLLLYKRLSYAVPSSSPPSSPSEDTVVTTPTATLAPEAVGDDDTAAVSDAEDDEAMLLAKAMALSMSAAGRAREAGEPSESKRDDGDVDGNDNASNDADSDKRGASDCSSGATALQPPQRTILHSILKEVEQENATFLHHALAATSSRVHADDLHALLLLRHNTQLRLRALLQPLNSEVALR